MVSQHGGTGEKVFKTFNSNDDDLADSIFNLLIKFTPDVVHIQHEFGLYGPRYGVKLRKRIKDIEEEKVKRHVCPRCQHESVKRISTGIWKCRRCNLTFASGAYSPVQSKTTAVEAYKPTEEETNV